MKQLISFVKMNRAFRLAAYALLAALLVGIVSVCIVCVVRCDTISALISPTPSPSPAPTATPSPTPSPSPTPTATPSPTPSPSPTPTPVPTPLPLGQFDWSDLLHLPNGSLHTEHSYESPNMKISVRKVFDETTYSDYIHYYVADIYIDDITLLRTACYGEDFNKRSYGSVLEIAERENAIVAISGDYYAHMSKSLVIRNGEVYRTSLSKYQDICVLYRDGTMKVFTYDSIDLDAILNSDVWQAWQFGPTLTNPDGSLREEFPVTDISPRNPRCAIGYYEPGHYCFVVVDGRQSKFSKGLTLEDLAKLMKDLGCTVAFNLDGGASAHFIWQNDVYNRPSGGGRSMSDIVYISDPEWQDSPLELKPRH